MQSWMIYWRKTKDEPWYYDKTVYTFQEARVRASDLRFCGKLVGINLPAAKLERDGLADLPYR